MSGAWEARLRCGTCGAWEARARVLASGEPWVGQNVCQRCELLAILKRLGEHVPCYVNRSWDDNGARECGELNRCDGCCEVYAAEALIRRVEGT